MPTHIKTCFLFYTFTLFILLSSFFLSNTIAQDNTQSVATPTSANYTYETVDVPGVDFLALTASSDFEDYAGYTKSPDGEKDVAFTLINGVFTRYDFPEAKNTYFYALGNDGQAAGHYEDSGGLYHGVVLENGELREYDFPNAVQTEIYGISDTTGALTGNFIDASGVRRGFSGNTIVEVPGAAETYADFVSATGAVIGSYVDSDGVYHGYVRAPDGRFIFADVLDVSNLEYFFAHGVNDFGVAVVRAKAVGDIPRTYVGRFGQIHELRFPGSVTTEGWNINQDGSVVGHYKSADGRTHGFIARPITDTDAPVDDQPVVVPVDANYTYESIDVPGVQFLELTASSDFGDYAGNTKNEDGTKTVGFTLINGVFTRHDFPDSQNTYFYALGNSGKAAGHYEDSDGLYQGVVLENGELREYKFPGAVQTQIYGISDTTGALTGNFIDTAGVRRGFSGDTIVEVPGATETYADFVSASGAIVGSYVDSDGIYHAYARAPDGRFGFADILKASDLEYLFTHGINDVGIIVVRAKAVGDIPRTYVGRFGQLHELQFPDSVSTEGYNINQDGSVVGHYDTADGRRHGFIARPTEETTAPPDEQPVEAPANSNYTFETIDVPGVDFLALTASSDYEDYAGYTRSPDSEKIVAWTLIGGVFKTYSFPDSQDTRFYALGNNGKAAGHYLDSNGHSHGVVLENGELRQYDFPNAVQTEIYGISDTTDALTGNYIDASGIRRGFSGDTIVEFPGALETYADFVNSEGGMVGSYVDADGIYHGYVRVPDGGFVSLNLTTEGEQEYFFIHGINDARVVVARDKPADGLPRTYVGLFPEGLQELKFPGSVSTEGWNINQDGSVVGHYDTADGRRHGFIARPITDTTPPVDVTPPVFFYYTFETIDVPGVQFLALTASSDFEDYAGYTRSADGEKEVAFTLINGVFTTYDFPGSQKTHFYALGNNGKAAGHYEDNDGLYHGVILENGELRQYDFPGAVQTFIYGISDATGALTGSFIDASGVRRGFSEDLIIEYPEASETYAEFTNSEGGVIGSFVDAQDVFYPYIRNPDGRFISLELPHAAQFEYFFLPAVNDAGIVLARAKLKGDIPRTAVGSLQHGLQSLEVPGSVSTEGWNINQDGSIVGYYDSADGRRHGFIARPTTKAISDHFGNTFNVTLTKGLNMLSLPLASPKPMTAKSFAGLTGATVVIALDAEDQSFIGWTPSSPDDGFPIEGGQGYIVNVPEPRSFAFVGAPWADQTEAAAAPAAISTVASQEAWAFVVSGKLDDMQKYDGYLITVRNTRTNTTMTAQVNDNYFVAATADLTRRSVVQVGDTLEVVVTDTTGNVASEKYIFTVTPDNLANALLSVKLDDIGQPNKNKLLQNYPNPFNPETWIPYQLSAAAPVSISIYDATGGLVRTLDIGYQAEGFYHNRGRAAYWDGKNTLGERVASGVYFYRLETPSFQQTRRFVIVK